MSDTTDSQSNEIVHLINGIVAQLPEPSTVVFRTPMDNHAIADLLQHPHVASVILDAPNEFLVSHYPDRVGWYDLCKSSLILPNIVAKELVYVGNQWSFGMRAGYQAWRAGVRRLCFVYWGQIIREQLPHELTRLLLPALIDRLPKGKSGRIVEAFVDFQMQPLAKQLNNLRFPPYISTPKRIMLVSGSLGPGGSERQVTNTLLGLKAKGWHDITLLHLHSMRPPNDFFLPHLEAANIEFSQLNSSFHSSFPDWQSFPDLGELHELLRPLGTIGSQILSYIFEFLKKRPQVVHTWLDHVNITAGLAAAIIGVPRVIIGCRSLAPYHFPLFHPHMRALYRLLLTFPNVTIMNNSRAGAVDYEDWLGLKKGTVRVIHNGFDFSTFPAQDEIRNKKIDFRSRFDLPHEALVVGTVMRFSVEKRPLLWLEIAAAVRRKLPSAHFLIVGDGPLRSEMEARAAQEDLRNRVHFAGHQKDALAAISSMDLFLLTSREEGLPNVLVEAQALGVPVVTTNAGGAAETVNHGVTGWVLERDDSYYAADVLVKLMQDQVWLSRAREAGPVFVRGAFGVDRMLDETIAAYGGESNVCNLTGVNNESGS